MRKINAKFNRKDRAICVTVDGGHEFYYQPTRSNERILLFTMNKFSGSVFASFRSKGRNLKLTRVIERLPGMIEHVLRECINQKEAERQLVTARSRSNDCELAA